MAELGAIVGESGSGKSTSIRNLDPQKTFIVNVARKALPFRGSKKNYKERINEKKRNAYAENPDKKKEYNIQHKDEIAEYKKIWYQKNKVNFDVDQLKNNKQKYLNYHHYLNQ